MLIGRKKEQKVLTNLLKSDKSEFVAIYGRRRVGKTYLVRETFNYHFAFQHTGTQNGSKTVQIEEFAKSLRIAGMSDVPAVKDWYDAFFVLGNFLASLPEGKKVIFIDELPWMDTPKSDFVPALEHFWNGWATMRKDIVLIVCGSATSWIVSKIIKNYGGLHNRLTRKILLAPFSLYECELFVKSRELVMTRRQILETYMVLGGIPYYWTFLSSELSWSQNIDALFFDKNAELKDEFNALYSSLFRNPEPYIGTVTILGTKKAGMTRSEIVKVLGSDTGSTLTKVLEDLELCGFVTAYNSIGKTKKDTIFQLTDNFTLFYFKFVCENRKHDSQFWSHSIKKTVYAAWSGLAFERVCFQHAAQIKKALGIAGIVSSTYSWVYRPLNESESGVQIDMLLDRDDDVINLCEMKFSLDKYEITKSYDAELRRKARIFTEKTNTKKAVTSVMITTYGLVANAYAGDIQNQVTMDDLFER
ncbi:MAG: ATP-binding protein [Bacteroidales bacterium]|nr:ATP-binding protein [Bacteroidales bacterium]